jgi:hypothetical protein
MSPFGSHKQMVCDDMLQDTLVGFERLSKGEILLKDEQGYYVTHINRLDDGLADPHRDWNSPARVK